MLILAMRLSLSHQSWILARLVLVELQVVLDRHQTALDGLWDIDDLKLDFLLFISFSLFDAELHVEIFGGTR